MRKKFGYYFDFSFLIYLL